MLRVLFLLGIYLAAQPAGAEDAQNLFDQYPGLVDFYRTHRSSDSFSELACPPGVSKKEFAAGATPCGPVVPLDSPSDGGPISPCGESGACGPGVGLEGGVTKLPLEIWKPQAVPGL